ncbi:MAG: hypothetical protein E7570_03910 [Ruminococcaceae bacterium]|nr:hypothetical protein [Oscillospiraceae bacterium]
MNKKEFLEKANGSIFDICTKYYREYIDGKINKEQKEAFLYLLKWNMISDYSLKIESIYTDGEYNELIEKTSDIVDKFINGLVEKRVSEKEFYKCLWELYSNESIFNGHNERISALINIFSSPYIPYFCFAEGINITDDEYTEIFKNNMLNTQKFLFIISNNYDKKSEEASLIYNLFKDLSTEKEKIVFLSSIIDYYNFRYEALLNSVSSEKE